MDIRNANVPPTIEHGGTCLSYFLIGKEEMRRDTLGSYLEFVSEFELQPGAALEPHRHNSDEFYYLLSGEARMTIAGEEREIGPGDLVHIPRNAVHSIRPRDPGQGFRALAFAVGYMPEGAAGYVLEGV
jgi:oxalate decarboxylase/phosphoglucose isomerase-like protein (cupin superfamily)